MIEAELLEDPEESDNREPIGRLKARVVRIGRAINDGVKLFEVFDSIDQIQMDYGNAVFDFEDDGIKAELVDSNQCGDVLMLMAAEVLPAFRGYGLGLYMVRSAIDALGSGASVVVVEPHPIKYPADRIDKWAKAMEPRRLPKDKRKGRQRLQRYWAQLGFAPIPGTTKRFWYLSMEAVAPKWPKEGDDHYFAMLDALYPEGKAPHVPVR